MPGRWASRSSTTPRTRRSPRAPRRPRATSRPCSGSRAGRGRAEAGSVARSIAILADVVRDVPGARLHLTHVSTAASLAQVRAGEGRGPAGDVRRHAAPPRRSPTSGSPGSRRWSWDAVDGDGARPRPVGRRLDHGGAVRHVAARQPAAAPGRGRDRVPRGAAGRHRGRHRHRPRPAHRGRQARRVRLGGQRDQRHRDGDRHRAGGGGRGRPAARPRDRGADDRAGRGPRASRGRGAGAVPRGRARGPRGHRPRRDRGASSAGVAPVEGQELAAARARAARASCG